MSDVIRSYRDLIVWQKAMDFAVQVYESTNEIPREEQFGLTTQIRRAAVSIASNIAEGRGRRSTREFLRFLAIAYGSVAEVETQLILAQRLRYMQADEVKNLLTLAAEICRLINGLRNSLRERLR